MKITKRKTKRKGPHPFMKRIGSMYYKSRFDIPKVTAACINTDFCENYDEIKTLAIRQKIVHKRICLFGDAKYPPLPFPIFRYYLNYNKDNFIGEELMGIYGENAYLTFHLDYPEDFEKYKHIMHRSVYLGSMAHILLICRNEAVLPRKQAAQEAITDYNIIVLKDTNTFLPHHDKLKTFIQNIPKKI